MSAAVWSEALQMLAQAAGDTFPDVRHVASAGSQPLAPATPHTPSTPQPASPQRSTPGSKQARPRIPLWHQPLQGTLT